MKYYIATKLENHKEHNRIRDLLNARGHEITYDWTHHGAVYTNGIKAIDEIAELETQGVLDADFVVVLWPGGRGTHVEMGISIGAKIPVIFISDNSQHHVASPEICAFYRSKYVHSFTSIEEALNANIGIARTIFIGKI